jgi:hypothetical protein
MSFEGVKGGMYVDWVLTVSRDDNMGVLDGTRVGTQRGGKRFACVAFFLWME